MKDEFLESLRRQFILADRKWRINGRKRTPNKQDLEKTLDEAVQSLYTSGEDWDEVQVGGLIIQKVGTKIDVYMWMGEYGDNDARTSV